MSALISMGGAKEIERRLYCNIFERSELCSRCRLTNSRKSSRAD
jgi:hypothetical protein